MKQNYPTMEGPVCPLPLDHKQQILIGHGSGGKLSHDLIRNIFLPAFDNPTLRANDDAGVVSFQSNFQEGESFDSNEHRLAISTDSHVVWPLFFPGGDIGKLAVCGTVNDVAMMGADPKYLTAGFILEEGLEISTLQEVVNSMHAAAEEAGVTIIAGDTKVVQKGKADGIYINTTGVGIIHPGTNIGGAQAQPGDLVILSGYIGDHGIAVLSARGDLGFKADIQSDIAPLNHLIQTMLQASLNIHVLRDPTRGGLATTLNEIAQQSQVCIYLNETSIPIRPVVSSACEMLGFDPFYIANEGKLIAIIPSQEAEVVLQSMRAERYGHDSVIIGEVASAPKGRVLLKTAIGSTRIVDIPTGEILPRIC